MKNCIFISVFAVLLLWSSTVSAQVKKIDRDTFIEKILNVEDPEGFEGDRPCVVLFYGSYCGYSKKTLTSLRDLSKEFKNLDFYYVDVDEEQELVSELEIEGVPALLFVGEDYSRSIEGYASKSELRELIQELIDEN